VNEFLLIGFPELPPQGSSETDYCVRLIKPRRMSWSYRVVINQLYGSVSLFKKLVSAVLLNKLPALMEPEGSLPCSQKLTNEVCSDSVKSSSHPCAVI
jgi:hypothetical protein